MAHGRTTKKAEGDAAPKPDGVQETIKKVNKKVAKEVARRRRTVRNFPASPFEEPLHFASQIYEFGSGEPVRRLSLFDYIGKAPESGPSRQLITNAGRYGLIKGGTQADMIELTPDGARAVDPEIPPRDQARARIKLAIEDIEVFARLHERFVGRALPAKAALIDAAMGARLLPRGCRGGDRDVHCQSAFCRIACHTFRRGAHCLEGPCAG